VLGDVAREALDGAMCMRKPGAALTSMMPPPFSESGCVRSGATTSMPATSNPTMRAMRSKSETLNGMNVVRAVNRGSAGGDVRGRFEIEHLTGGHDGVERVAARSEQLRGLRVNFDQSQNVLMAVAAARSRFV
jgi:hypothetical protein